MAQYAADTQVSVDKSKSEIECTLQRYGADQFMYGWMDSAAAIGFRIQNRMVKIVLPLPNKSDQIFTHHSRGMRTTEAAFNAWEQACRQRWRALALVIKAKLEAVECGISTIEKEFLADTVLSDGQTMYQRYEESLSQMYLNGKMPPLLTA